MADSLKSATEKLSEDKRGKQSMAIGESIVVVIVVVIDFRASVALWKKNIL